MEIKILKTKIETSKEAANKGIALINKAVKEKGSAVFVMATGNSQLDLIEFLVADKSINWSKTKMFHLDEYIGLPESHSASFRKYLKGRFISKVNKIGEVNLINGDTGNPKKECQSLNQLLKKNDVDVAFVGIGENGHLAFNDPIADFEIEDPFIIVDLDEKCRQQQVNEGWFSSIEEVPKKAISMSIQQIMKSQNIICTVPGKRKAQAVKDCFGNQDISPSHPASILKKHKNCTVYLDEDSSIYL